MATNTEILEAAVKNAEYILKLELEIEKRNDYIRSLRTALHNLAVEVVDHPTEAYKLLDPKYEKEFGLNKRS